jgi:hypothetical protein
MGKRRYTAEKRGSVLRWPIPVAQKTLARPLAPKTGDGHESIAGVQIIPINRSSVAWGSSTDAKVNPIVKTKARARMSTD